MKSILMKKPITILGLVLIVVGLAGPTVLATLNIDTVPPSIAGSFPAGTVSSPQSIFPNTNHTVYVATIERLPLGGAWVLIAGVNNTLPTEEYLGAYGAWKYSKSWTSPASGTMRFDFSVKDAAGNTSTRTTYAIVGTPSGDFYINNQGPLNTTSIITLATHDIAFKCVPTNYAGLITRVYIKITGGASVPVLDLTKGADGNWTASWAAPGDGSYTISGYVVTGDSGYQMMRIVVGIPNPIIAAVGSAVGYLAYIGIALVVMGLIIKR